MVKEKWLSRDGRSFYVGTKPKATDKLNPGIYKISIDPFGQIYFNIVEDKSDELLDIETSTVNDAIKEIDNFWTKKDFFVKHKFPFRRGILFHGPAGTGKSSTIKQITKKVVDKGGIAIFVSDFGAFINGMKLFRSIQPNTHVVAIIEDIDSLLEYQELQILNALDGFGGFDGVVYVATTNYLENIPDRIRNRPSRFDRLFFVDYPNEESRRIYFNHLSKKDNITIPVDEWVTKTNGLSYAHLKELFVSHICFETPTDEIIERLTSMSTSDLDEDDGSDMHAKAVLARKMCGGPTKYYAEEPEDDNDYDD